MFKNINLKNILTTVVVVIVVLAFWPQIKPIVQKIPFLGNYVS